MKTERILGALYGQALGNGDALRALAAQSRQSTLWLD